MQEAFRRRIMAAACSTTNNFRSHFSEPMLGVNIVSWRQAHYTQRQVIHPQAITAHEHGTHCNRCGLQDECQSKKPMLLFQPAH